jgi:hypothetical protein
LRNIAVTVGQIRYESNSGKFYLSDLQVQDVDFGQRPYLVAAKPHILNAINEFLQPFLAERPLYDLSGKRYMGLPLAWYALEDVGIDVVRDRVSIKMKIGPEIF